MATSPRQSSRRRAPQRRCTPRTPSRKAFSSSRSPLPPGVRRTGVILLIAVIGILVYLVASARSIPGKELTSGATTPSMELLKVVNPSGTTEELLKYTGMDISFNPSTHQPNWVAWELLGSETEGPTEREPGFSPDPAVDGCATPQDYRHTGFDRGHMAPAGDMKWHPQAMRESFYMTNISPQAGDLNRGAWKKLEEKCRVRAVADSALIIVCGPIFDTGQPSARIGATGVAVPSRFFKVILAPYVARPWAIGFIMPNSYVEGGMQKAAVSVDEVERVTGYDFFSALPDSLENRIEVLCDFNAFSRIPRNRAR